MPRPVHASAGASPRRRAFACVLLAACIGGSATAQSPRPAPAPAPQTQPKAEPASERPAWMGVRAAPGVHVQEVIPGGPADKAGMKDGDLLTGVNGKSTIEEPGLMGALSSAKPGDTLVLDVLRDGEELRLKLVLGEFPSEYLEEREKALAEERAARPQAPPRPAPPAPPELPLGSPGAVMTWLGPEKRPFLGVRVQDLSEGLARYLGLPEDSPGVLVEHVHEESPAASAGLRAGDVLLSLDGKSLSDMTALGDQIRKRSTGDEVTLTWWREGEETSASATLAAREKDIWVVSPPEPGQDPTRAKALSELESRLRTLEAQAERNRAEREQLLRQLDALRAKTPKR